ncbi:hypothetical protein BDV37DRAFT_279915 [Aspergillus pseudonomiae]|uniref:BZIP domain-containing protein n=1 Tax=Aspergillus pseudonomiae TaxID=1506151 RepID=A0A5N7DLQ3_9EURO|nr:uncharacterized protein BDV37DRAFT_279915 [Aspergillus pseudonomiae]KAE8407381.1 hypothetical protein BDV37DRAFT_279915 [Aspergillus pseudonomiae]
MENRRQTRQASRLQDVLSARRYISADRGASVEPEPVSNVVAVPSEGHEKIISSPAVQSSESPTEKANQDPPSDSMPKVLSRLHVRRSAGRPRMDASSGGAVLSEDRRDQIRRAQRTYRLKKEAALEKAKERAAGLEDRLTMVATAVADYKAAFPSEIKSSYPALVRHLDCISDLLASTSERLTHPRTQTSTPSSVDSDKDTSQHNAMYNDPAIKDTPKIDCGCLEDFQHKKHKESAVGSVKKRSRHVSFSDELEDKSHSRSTRIQHIARLHSKDTHYTYSFQEKDFCRRLQRYSLEYAFRLFTDARSHPLEVYRVFRLVPCIQDRTQMYPYFRKLVSAGAKDALEIPNLPLYSIGGVGTHYPRKDPLGNPIYPTNTRTPKRVLGLFQPLGGMGEVGQQPDHQKFLEVCGYGGEWFDCRDVEGFLREQGVDLDASSLFPSVHDQRSSQISQSTETHGQAGDMDAYQSINDFDSHSHEETDIATFSACLKSRMLDIEQFLSMLLRGVVILGRAPSFRRTDVEAAFKTALMIHR